MSTLRYRIVGELVVFTCERGEGALAVADWVAAAPTTPDGLPARVGLLLSLADDEVAQELPVQGQSAAPIGKGQAAVDEPCGYHRRAER